MSVTPATAVSPSGAPSRAPLRPRREARLSALVAVLALLAGLAVAPPWGTADRIPEGFAARLVDGDLERLDGGSWVEVRHNELVRDGEVVRTTDGAELTVTGGAMLLGAATRAVLDDPLRLDAGSVLLAVDADRRVRLGHVVATGRGSWRVDAGPVERVAVYEGGVGVRPASGGDGVAVGRLDQAALLAGRLPERSLPLRYSSADMWDLRWLAPAMAVDREVDRLVRGLLVEYGADAHPREFYTQFRAIDDALFDGITQAMRADPDATGPVADVVVRATVARIVADQRGTSPAEAALEVERLLRDGATWGLVLARHRLGPGNLLDAIDLGLADAPPPAPTAPPAPVVDEPGEEGPDDPLAPPTPPAPPPDDDDDDDDGDGDDPGLVDDVADTVEEAVDDLLDLIGDIADDLPLPVPLP